MSSLNFIAQRLRRHARWLWLLSLLLLALWGFRQVSLHSQEALGHEYWWIAQSLAAGKGFSFDSNHRWLFVPLHYTSPSLEYFPTAWEEPVYPYFMALALQLGESHGQQLILSLQVLFLLLHCVVLYYLGRKLFNPATGMLASLMLVIWPLAHLLALHSLGPSTFAGLVASFLTYLLFWCLEKISVSRGMVMGLFLGLGCLIFAPLLLWIPITIVLVLTRNSQRLTALKCAVAVLLTALLTISPWTMRNAVVFEQFVLIKNGFGAISHVGNPILAETFLSDFQPCALALGSTPVKARNISQAIWLTRQPAPESRQALMQRSLDCIESEPPLGYSQFNEAQRDKVYSSKTREFVLAQPITFIALTFHKAYAFFRGVSLGQGMLSILAIGGAIVGFRNNRTRVLSGLVVAYALPYCLALPFYDRYRYPVDAILMLLGSYLLVVIASEVVNWRKSSLFS